MHRADDHHGDGQVASATMWMVARTGAFASLAMAGALLAGSLSGALTGRHPMAADGAASRLSARSP